MIGIDDMFPLPLTRVISIQSGYIMNSSGQKWREFRKHVAKALVLNSHREGTPIGVV